MILVGASCYLCRRLDARRHFGFSSVAADASDQLYLSLYVCVFVCVSECVKNVRLDFEHPERASERTSEGPVKVAPPFRTGEPCETRSALFIHPQELF